MSSNPAAIAKDALGLLVGAGLTLVGGAAVGGGGLLDATGVLLPAGVPLTVAGAAAITAGVGGAGYYGDQLIKDLGTSYARKVAPDEPGYGATPEPGEGTPVGGRPYDSELASRVPPWGVDGTPTTSGLLDVGDGDIVGIASGRDNLANEIVNGLPKGGLGRHGDGLVSAGSRRGASCHLHAPGPGGRRHALYQQGDVHVRDKWGMRRPDRQLPASRAAAYPLRAERGGRHRRQRTPIPGVDP